MALYIYMHALREKFVLKRKQSSYLPNFKVKKKDEVCDAINSFQLSAPFAICKVRANCLLA